MDGLGDFKKNLLLRIQALLYILYVNNVIISKYGLGKNKKLGFSRSVKSRDLDCGNFFPLIAWEEKGNVSRLVPFM